MSMVFQAQYQVAIAWLCSFKGWYFTISL
jgi:hypothetical protein